MKNENAYKGDKDISSWLMALIISLLPLIVRMKLMPVPKAASWYWGEDFADFFSGHKLIVLGILTLITLIVFFWEYKESINFNKLVLYSLLTYLALALLSTIFAPNGYKTIALLGAPERYEGLLAIILYVILFLIASKLAQNTANIKLINSALLIGGFALALIGLSQFFGVDFLQTGFGKSLMLPSQYSHLAEELSFTFGSGKGNIVYGTLFNPNYVGSYAALLLPIALVSTLYSYLYSDNLIKKIAYTISLALMLSLLLISRSRGGFVGTLVGLLIVLVLLGSYLIKTKKHLVFTILGLGLGIFGLNLVSNGAILSRIKLLPKEAKSLLGKAEASNQLEDIRMGETSVEIDSKTASFRIEQGEDGIIFIGASGEAIPLGGEDENALVPQDESYHHLSFQVAGPDEFKITSTSPHYSLHFFNPEDHFMVLGTGGRPVESLEVESIGFEGKERLGSSRGYIWSRTLPMIKDRWLLGYGLDTYPLNFPQHDLIGKINAYGIMNINVDKPHNLYLQTMVATGVPSLLVLVFLFMTYTVFFIRNLRETKKDDIRRWMSIGIYAALIAYLIAGLFNDSVISVAPVFWILWGLGLGLSLYKDPTLQS